jgi:hypothetical protein
VHDRVDSLVGQDEVEQVGGLDVALDELCVFLEGGEEERGERGG